MTDRFKHELKLLGMDYMDAPFTPILKEWERFPIVKAIRKVERILGEVYDHDPDVYIKELYENAQSQEEHV